MKNIIKVYTQAILDYEDSDLSIGTLKTLKFIDSESDKLQKEIYALENILTEINEWSFSKVIEIPDKIYKKMGKYI
jgi:hypothetical protein